MKARSQYGDKKLFIFDLDGTLTESKAPMDAEMSRLLGKLLASKSVAVIGGGKYEQFRRQFVAKLTIPKRLRTRLFLFPTSSTSFYRYRNGWRKVYREDLTPAEKKKIADAFKSTFRDVGYVRPAETWGVVVEDRGTQVTFSALGQRAPVPKKEEWRRQHNALRQKMAKHLQKLLPSFAVRVGGLTSVDVTRKGVDKAYGIRQIEKHLGVPRRDMLFVGDAIYPGGNDYAVVPTGVDYVKVSGPEETKKLIRHLLH